MKTILILLLIMGCFDTGCKEKDDSCFTIGRTKIYSIENNSTQDIIVYDQNDKPILKIPAGGKVGIKQ